MASRGIGKAVLEVLVPSVVVFAILLSKRALAGGELGGAGCCSRWCTSLVLLWIWVGSVVAVWSTNKNEPYRAELAT